MGSTWPWLSLYSVANSDSEGTNSWRLSLTSLPSTELKIEEGSERNISISITHMKNLEHKKRIIRIKIMLKIHGTMSYMETAMPIPEKGKSGYFLISEKL